MPEEITMDAASPTSNIFQMSAVLPAAQNHMVIIALEGDDDDDDENIQERGGAPKK